MAQNRGIGIRTKLIAMSTLLVMVAVGLFGVMNSIRSRRIINESSQRLRKEIIGGLRQAGTGQLELLAETTRIALVQSDYTTLQTIIQNTKKQDDRVTQVAVIDSALTYLANGDSKLVGSKAAGAIKTFIESNKQPPLRRSGVELTLGGQRMLAFSATLAHEGGGHSTVLLAYGLKQLERELNEAERLKREEVARSLKSTLGIGVLSILLGVVLAIQQGLRISRPIQALATQADRIASGDLLARVQIRSHDEIGLLGDRFNYMADQVVVLMNEATEKVTMAKELEVARAVQATLVPDDSPVELNGVSLAGYFKPATQCGGDWWGHFDMAGGKVLVVIGDVTGHGVAPAMITAAARGAVSALVSSTQGQVGLAQLLLALNSAIHETSKGKFVMTCFASLYDIRTRILEYANAGHTFPFVKHGETGRLYALVARGNRIGDVLDSEFIVKKEQIAPNSTVVWYTDGIVECENARGEEFGERRFRTLIDKSGHLAPLEVRQAIVRRAYEFYGNVPLKDDITLVVGRFA